MATLNKIATQIADGMGRPFDEMLHARLKDIIVQEAATLLQQTMDKDGVDREYRQTYIVDMKIVPADETNLSSNLTILRSINKIPTPIRFKNFTPFIYVGSKDGSFPYLFTNFYSASLQKYLPMIGEQISYDYIDKYLYIFNNVKLEQVRSDAIYPRNIMDNYRAENTDISGVCFADDMEFPLPMDLVNVLIQKIQTNVLGRTEDTLPVPKTHLDIE